MLGLGLGRLEGAGEDEDLGIGDFLLHLRVREVFVDNDTSHEGSVFQAAASLSDDLDVIKVNVSALQVSDGEHSLDSDVGHVILALADDLGAESGDGTLSEELVIVLLDVDLLLNLVNALNSNVTSSLEAVGNLQGVATLVEEFLSLVKEGAGQNDDTSGTVTDLIVLRLGKLDEETSSLVLNLHLLNNGGTVVGDNHVAIRAIASLV